MRSGWPEGVRGVSLEELDVLGVDRQGRLYWDGIPVQVSGHSTRHVQRGGEASPWVERPRPASEAVGAFHDSANLNLAKRRLCVALGISLGSSEHCCAISVARVRAALTASIPRSNRPLARRTNFGAAKSCSLVIIFMIRPPTAQSGDSNNAHRSRPYHGSRNSGDSERPMGAFNSGLGCPRSSRQSQTRLNTSAGSSP